MATTPEQQHTDDEQLPLPPWSVHVMVYGGALFALFNLAVSTGAVFELALDGFQIGLLRSIGLAGVLDTGALVFGTAWVIGRRTRRTHLVAVGMPITLGLVAMSVVINMGEIAFQQHKIDPVTLLYLALAIGAAAPITVLIMGHLVLVVLAMRTAEQQAVKPAKAKKAKAKEPPADVDAAAPEQPAPTVDLTKKQLVPEPTPIRPPLTVAGNLEKVYEAAAALARSETGPAGPKDIAAKAGLSPATTKRKLSELVEADRLHQPTPGVYAPPAAPDEAAEERAV